VDAIGHGRPWFALILCAVCLVPVQVAAAHSGQRVLDTAEVPAACLPVATASAQASFGHLPLSFEPNVGQFDPRALFVARGRDYTAALTASGAVLSLSSGAWRFASLAERQTLLAERGGASNGSSSREAQQVHIVRLSFVGADRDAKPRGLHVLAGRVNYFVGDNPRRWHTDIPTYTGVTYSNLYRGVTMIWHDHAGGLEYDWRIASGARIDRIRIRVSGVQILRVRADGTLTMRAGGASIVQPRPTAFQLRGGQRSPVHIRYRLEPDRTVGIVAGHYDGSRPLVIDPVLRFATFLSPLATVTGVGTDTQGDIYIAGNTFSPTFPGASPIQGEIHDGGDTYVAKLDPTGTSLIYGTYLGGTGARSVPPPAIVDPSKEDDAAGLAVGSDGGVAITRETRSEDFPVAHPLQSGFGGGICSGAHEAPAYCFDGYLTHLSAGGNRIMFSTYLGGADSDRDA
jgi:hypothetical protein